MKTLGTSFWLATERENALSVDTMKALLFQTQSEGLGVL